MRYLTQLAASVALTGLSLAWAGDNVGGGWSAVGSWPLIPLHAVLTPDGRVLTYGTDGNGSRSVRRHHCGPGKGGAKRLFVTCPYHEMLRRGNEDLDNRFGLLVDHSELKRSIVSKLVLV